MPTRCPSCRGRGVMDCGYCSGDGCRWCNSDGTCICPVCGGYGWINLDDD